MFNVGFMEIAVIAVLGLMFFGPEKLPKAIHTLMLGIRSLKGLANEASDSLQGAAGIDSTTAKQTMSDLADLHPKRWAASLLSDEPSVSTKTTSKAKSDSTGDADTTVDLGGQDPSSAESGSGEDQNGPVVELDSGSKSEKPQTVQHRAMAADLDPDLP